MNNFEHRKTYLDDRDIFHAGIDWVLRPQFRGQRLQPRELAAAREQVDYQSVLQTFDGLRRILLERVSIAMGIPNEVFSSQNFFYPSFITAHKNQRHPTFRDIGLVQSADRTYASLTPAVITDRIIAGGPQILAEKQLKQQS